MLLFQFITAIPDGPQLIKPWQLFLEQKPWRKSESGEIVVNSSLQFSGMDPHGENPRVPFNSAKFPDETEITSPSDISRTLKFARDSQWPFFVSVASTFDNTNAITVTYQSNLEGCEDSVDWFWFQFLAQLKIDNMLGLPVASRVGANFTKKCFIGDYCLHVMLYEEGVETTECDGTPCFFVYAPRAVMKFRAEDVASVHRMITMCYNEEPRSGEQLHGKFWALIEGINGGEIPKQCYLKLRGTYPPEVVYGYNRDTFMAGQASAPYRSGIGKFAAQFKPDKPFAATMAIETGLHGEHSIAILFEQKTRRCLLSERYLSDSDVDTFWRAMKLWAEFDPRAAKPRSQAGQLYYPAVYSHMVEQY
jgi:hypothetical protein